MKKYIIVLNLLVVLAISGCKKFLDEKSETSFTTSTLFDTPEGLEKMVIALYPYERSFTGKGINNIPAAIIWGERTTDLNVFLTGDDANLSRFTSPGPGSNIDNDIYSQYWSHRYYLIGRTNEIIHYGKQLGDATKSTVAEASFWRAYCYYGLWSRFSRLYLSTEPVTKDNLNDQQYKPADSAGVFKLMYDDLNVAIEGLPLQVSANNEGRVSKSAARHLKALVAAWAKDWNEVAAQVDEVDKD
ncbi:MAG TPA: RagB/SusD family nutrient uptake outer membrane protein, partial [Hanamia sp.]|nr:RagB/SusD family nutrient uptake outer membrane protein [Hanamia sp.]